MAAQQYLQEKQEDFLPHLPGTRSQIKNEEDLLKHLKSFKNADEAADEFCTLFSLDDFYIKPESTIAVAIICKSCKFECNQLKTIANELYSTAHQGQKINFINNLIRNGLVISFEDFKDLALTLENPQDLAKLLHKDNIFLKRLKLSEEQISQITEEKENPVKLEKPEQKDKKPSVSFNPVVKVNLIGTSAQQSI